MKIKILIKYLSQGDEEGGVFFLEKRTIGKFLCYKRGEWETKIKLSKKTYKNLSRFSRTTLEKECEITVPESEEVEECCGVYFSIPQEKKHKTSYHPANRYVKKEKAPFVVEWFSHV